MLREGLLVEGKTMNDIVKKYAEIDDTIFMSVEEAKVLSEELAERAKQLNIEFDEIVGIANGARLMTTIIAEKMGLPFQMLKIRRKGSVIKEYLSRFPLLIRFFSFWYSIPVLKYPLVRVMCRLRGLADTSDISTAKKGEVNKPKNILIVDDALEFGSTIQAAKTIMQNNNDNTNIVVAVISWRVLRPNEEQVANPDIFITRMVHHYPWSMNSPHYEEYEQWLADNNA